MKSPATFMSWAIASQSACRTLSFFLGITGSPIRNHAEWHCFKRSQYDLVSATRRRAVCRS